MIRVLVAEDHTIVREGIKQLIGLAKDMQVVAIDGMAYNADRLKRALVTAQSSKAPIEMLVRQGDTFRTLRIDYHAGLRYPHLQRVEGAPDRLTRLLAPRK